MERDAAGIAGVVTVRVTVPPGFADVEEREQPTPRAVGAEQLSVTALVKPPTLAMATLKVATPPAETIAVEGDGVMEKPGVELTQDGNAKEPIRVAHPVPV